MKMKKAIAMVLAFTMVMAMLVGCGAPKEEAQKEEAPKEEAATETQSSAAEVTEEDITITMMWSGTAAENDFELDVLPKLVKEAFPNITLEVTKLPDDQYYTALKTRLASGECADMILTQPKYAGSNSVIGLAKAGYLEPLNGMDVLNLVSESSWDAYAYDGGVYAMPATISTLGTFYNKDVFEEHGLSIPQNWPEFLDVCKTLKEAGVQPIVMGDKDMYVMQFGLYQIAANQVYPKNPAFDDQLRTGETKFTDDGTWNKVLDMYKTLYDNEYIESSSLGLGAQQAIQKFVDGDAAMTFDGNFNAAPISAQGAAEFERGYFPLPGNDEGEELYAAISAGGGPSIYSGSKYINECKAIMELWFDGESDIWRAYIDSGRYIPAYGYGVDAVNPFFTEFVKLYGEGKSFYWCNQAWPAGTENEMQALLSETIGGQGTTVDDIVNGMQNKFEELYVED